MARRSIVLGFGASGYAAARLLVREGELVTVVDRNPCERHADWQRALEAEGVRVCCGIEELPCEPFDTAVVSPGVRADHPWVEALRRAGTEVVSEMECGWRRCRAPILAVTGTNGKSTVVKFCADALRAAGLKAVEGGNYGSPLSALVVESPDVDWYVIEVSSFQLELQGSLKPRIALLLNLQPDHLDRHGDMEIYEAVKNRLFARMGTGDTAVVPVERLGRLQGQFGQDLEWITFGAGGDADFSGGRVILAEGQVSCAGTLFDNAVLGAHLAASAAALVRAGVPLGVVEKTASDFLPLPHRMNRMGCVNGVEFINDSKSTTISSIGAALQMSHPPVRLIAGGLLKEKKPDIIKEQLAMCVTKVYLIGKAAAGLAESWRTYIECETCGTLGAAVKRAWSEAQSGDVILLSPGCASFDQFENFADRGQQFIALVEQIKRGDES